MRVPKIFKPLDPKTPTLRLKIDWLDHEKHPNGKLKGNVHHDKINLKMLMDNMRLAKAKGYTRFDFVSAEGVSYAFWNKANRISKKGKYKLRIKYSNYDKWLWTFNWDENNG